MISIVREHNLLNGFRAALVEYAMVAIGLGLLAGYYLLHGRPIEAIAWLGVVTNAAAIAAFAAHSIIDGEPDFGNFPMRRRAFREAIAASHSNLGRRTSVLVVVQCVPYLLAALVVIEAAGRRMRRPAW